MDVAKAELLKQHHPSLSCHRYYGGVYLKFTNLTEIAVMICQNRTASTSVCVIIMETICASGSLHLTCWRFGDGAGEFNHKSHSLAGSTATCCGPLGCNVAANSLLWICSCPEFHAWIAISGLRRQNPRHHGGQRRWLWHAFKERSSTFEPPPSQLKPL